MSSRLASRAIGLCAALTVMFVITGARPAAAQCGVGTPPQLCASGAGDCKVDADCTITVPAAGLTIDLGARKLEITKTLTVAGPGGAGLTINVGNLLLDGGSIVAPGADDTAGNVTILSAGDITVQNNATIDVSAGLTAGIVDLEALGGNVSFFSGRVKANGTTRGGFGGTVALFAMGSATVKGSMIDVSGGDQGSGGSIALDALNGSMGVDVPLNAAGGDGGDIEISAGTTLETTSATLMNIGANGDGGFGGTIDLSSVDNLTVGGETTGRGSPAASSEDGQSGGDGGELDVFSQNGNVTINGKVDLSGAAAGSGGTVDITGLNLTFSKAIVAQGSGADGFGGDVTLFAAGTLTLPQQIDVRGGDGSGGSIAADSLGNLTVSGSLLADGDSFGGTIVLKGCVVNITSTALVSAQGPGGAEAGSNTVQASSTMTIRGTLRATSQNLLQYRAAPAPSLTGATIQPAETLLLDPTLPCCVSCPSTTTTTSTTTSTTVIATTTTTSTTTSTTVIATTTTTTTTTSSSTTTTTTSSTTTTTVPVSCLPRPSCLPPVESEAAQLKLKDSAKGAEKDQLQWKWTKGAATTLEDFADPVTSDGLVLCIFDRSQTPPRLLFQAIVPPDGLCGTKQKPCWVVGSKSKNFKFASKTGNSNGVTGLTLTPGEAGKAKIKFNAKGAALTGRPFGLPAPPLPLPLTVQLQSDNGNCWEASYAQSGVKKNAGEDFEAKSE